MRSFVALLLSIAVMTGSRIFSLDIPPRTFPPCSQSVDVFGMNVYDTLEVLGVGTQQLLKHENFVT